MCLAKTFADDILNSLGEGVFTVDKNFKINFFNRAAEKITGVQREEAVGKFCRKIFESPLCKNDCPIAAVLEKGENLYDIDTDIHAKDGDKIPLRVNATVLKDRETREPVGGVISFRDLSQFAMIKQAKGRPHHFCNVVGRSKVMQEIFQLIEEISDSNANVFIQGESGTGKEMIANAVQMTSLRRNNPFVKVNCSVFPSQLLASELFGHVRGAFTGAIKDRIGRFELSHEGTLFLDEIAEMPQQMQLQLLRVLQDGTFERIGESVTRRVDVRIIAATNADVKRAIAEGKFREDLYYRLNVIPIEIPPLRERRADIPILVQHFVQKYSAQANKKIIDVENSAMDLLLNYSWPGNIRELENVIECAVVRTKNSSIAAAVLPPRVRGTHISVAPVKTQIDPESEYQNIVALLKKNQWNRSKVARELHIGRTTLWRKMKHYGLSR